jgi:dipeptide/tripeptide permease
MTETHFFRRVNADNADAVSVFRTMKPVGALVAPIIGTLLLSVAGYANLFAIAGFGILIAGLASALAIKPLGGPRSAAAASGTLPNTGAP